MENQLLVEENTHSHYARAPWAAAKDAARRTQLNSAQLTPNQMSAVNKLYELVCRAYDCRVFKNIRKTCATIKAEYVDRESTLAAVKQLHDYCRNNGIKVQRNVNTESVSYVLMF